MWKNYALSIEWKIVYSVHPKEEAVTNFNENDEKIKNESLPIGLENRSAGISTSYDYDAKVEGTSLVHLFH